MKQIGVKKNEKKEKNSKCLRSSIISAAELVEHSIISYVDLIDKINTLGGFVVWKIWRQYQYLHGALTTCDALNTIYSTILGILKELQCYPRCLFVDLVTFYGSIPDF